ncbi:hypothetical protein E2562_034423 [Oryza meyeriana var. granulata]|uniref:Yippee domain-containing protein n=1 Tax=Oryza meyeriana var. granulata TaxID=110450 RepID=A0A6G1BQB3_9ORYZ|nr:hypothetical protein E2562_034423 [Oryza meyeriana var. granulata]
MRIDWLGFGLRQVRASRDFVLEEFVGGGVDGGAGGAARVQLLQLPEPRLPPRRHHLQGLSGRLPGSFSSSGRNGRAFLFSHAMNVVVGAKEDRQLMTGLHTVADIYCNDCREVLGWKYERAYEETQKYKEGKFIFEKSKIVKENCQSMGSNLKAACSCLPVTLAPISFCE